MGRDSKGQVDRERRDGEKEIVRQVDREIKGGDGIA